MIRGEFPIEWAYDGIDYVVTLGIREVFGRIEPIAISVRPKDESEPRVLTKTVLRAVPVTRLMTEVLAEVRDLNEVAITPQVPVLNDDQMDPEFRAKREAFAADLNRLIIATGEGNGRRWGPEHYRQVLSVCAEADLWHEPRGKAVARVFGLQIDTASKHIERAKKLAIRDEIADAPAPTPMKRRK